MVTAWAVRGLTRSARAQGAARSYGISLFTEFRYHLARNRTFRAHGVLPARRRDYQGPNRGGLRSIVVSDACLSDTDQGHANSLAVIKKWFGETPTADEVLSALK